MKKQIEIASEPKNSNLTRTLTHETRKNRQGLTKLISISMLVALLIGVVTLSSCKKDEDSLEDIGKKAAKELCDCFKESTVLRFLTCVGNIEEKYEKYEDNEEFLKGVASVLCNPSKPSWWDDETMGDWEDFF